MIIHVYISQKNWSVRFGIHLFSDERLKGGSASLERCSQTDWHPLNATRCPIQWLMMFPIDIVRNWQYTPCSSIFRHTQMIVGCAICMCACVCVYIMYIYIYILYIYICILYILYYIYIILYIYTRTHIPWCPYGVFRGYPHEIPLQVGCTYSLPHWPLPVDISKPSSTLVIPWTIPIRYIL